jgi:hypothetical protein
MNRRKAKGCYYIFLDISAASLHLVMTSRDVLRAVRTRLYAALAAPRLPVAVAVLHDPLRRRLVAFAAIPTTVVATAATGLALV